tara:strand:- start:3809 stop:4483 length:675 start_codon:yes stop_codon:yes gene_type:complete
MYEIINTSGIIDVIYVSGIFSIGFFLSLIFVSQLLRVHKLEIDGLDFVPYDERYKLTDLDDSNNGKPIGKNFIIENTPNGLIVMKYEEDCFKYWSKKAEDFKYLNTAARKYCLTFHRKNLYIDSYDEYEKQKEQFEKRNEDARLKAMEEVEEEEEEEEESIFVKPKMTEMNNKTQKSEAKVTWIENKFKWMGKIEASPLVRKKIKKEEKFSFGDFKKLMRVKKN